MAAPTVTFDGTNINDGTKYSVLEGAVLGGKVTTFDEYRGYGGTVAVANVSTANLIGVSIPMMVMGTSVSDLRTNLTALNTIIDGCASGTGKALVFDGVTYTIVASSQVAPTLTQSYQNKFIAFVELVLNRKP